LSATLTNLLHRLLHLFFQLGKPVFDVTFSLDSLVKSDVFFGACKDLMDLYDEFTVLLIKSNSVDSVEKFFEVILDSVRVRALRKNLKQVSIRTEVETGEDTSLLFKIRVELLLALLEVHLHLAER
jgi:hypothetical protein